MKDKEQIIEDTLAAFRDKKILPMFGSFGSLCVVNGTWRLQAFSDGTKCGCAVSALVDGTPCTVEVRGGDRAGAAAMQVVKEYGLDDAWGFIFGYDDSPNSYYSQEDCSIGARLRERVLQQFGDEILRREEL